MASRNRVGQRLGADRFIGGGDARRQVPIVLVGVHHYREPKLAMDC